MMFDLPACRALAGDVRNIAERPNQDRSSNSNGFLAYRFHCPSVLCPSVLWRCLPLFDMLRHLQQFLVLVRRLRNLLEKWGPERHTHCMAWVNYCSHGQLSKPQGGVIDNYQELEVGHMRVSFLLNQKYSSSQALHGR